MIDIKTFIRLALSFPGATEKPHFNLKSFRTKKIFATLDVKNKRACLMLSEVDQSVFCSFNKSILYPVPNKWGKHGATYVELTKVPKRMLKDALTQAYNRSLMRALSVKK